MKAPPHGSPDEIVDRGVLAGAAVTTRWADWFAGVTEHVRPARHTILVALAHIGAGINVHALVGPVAQELIHAGLLGALDAEWEAENDEAIKPVTFSRFELDMRGVSNFATKPFAAAVEDFKTRKILPRADFDKLDFAGRRRAFTVSGLARHDMLATAHDELAKAIEEGSDLRAFSKRLRARFDTAGWTQLNPSHVENIFRTNVMSAYSAGRIQQMSQPAILAARPYWQILGVDDSRTRPTHKAAHKKILRADDPFWTRAAPPFGFQCRCRLVSRSQADIDRGAGPVVTGGDIEGLPDEGFDSKGIAAPGPIPPPPPPPVAPPPKPPAPPPAPIATPGTSVIKGYDSSHMAMVANAFEDAPNVPYAANVMRAALRQPLDALGLASRDAEALSARASGAGGDKYAEDVALKNTSAAAYHDWTGKVVCRPGYAKEAADGLKQIATYTPSTPAWIVEQDQARLETLLHEEVHGCSPMLATSYKGVGAAMEEAGTELLARKATREMCGYKLNTTNASTVPFRVPNRMKTGEFRHTGQAYDSVIKKLLKATEQTIGYEADFFERVEQALIDMRKTAKRWAKPEEHVKAYAKALGRTPAERKKLLELLLAPGHFTLSAMAARSVFEIPRNDVPAAIAYVRSQIRAHGSLAPDDAEILIMLQDDPKDYIAAVSRLLGAH